MNAFRMLHTFHPVPAFPPGDISPPPAPDYAKLRMYGGSPIALQLGIVGAAFTVSVKQARDVDGAGEKPLPFDKYFEAAGAADDDRITEKQATDAGEATARVEVLDTDDRKLLFIPIHAGMLDVTNGYTCVRVDVTDPGAPTFASAVYWLDEPRNGGPVAVHPSAIK